MDTTRIRRHASGAAPLMCSIPAGVRAAWRSGCACACALAVVGLLAPVPAARAQAVGEESRIKAAMIYNLARAVAWPAGLDRQEQFIIAVAGSDSVAAGMATIAGKHVDGKPVVVTGGNAADAGRSCRILFISRDAPEAALYPAGATARPGVLTVSDAGGFCERGGIVELRADRGRIRLLINRAAAAAAGLRLSSQILKVAELVDSDRVAGGDTAQSLPPR